MIVRRLAKVAGLEAVLAETGQSFAEVEAERAAATPGPTGGDGRAAR